MLKHILFKMTEPFCACSESQVKPYVEMQGPRPSPQSFGLIFGCDHCGATLFHPLGKPTLVLYQFDKPRPKGKKKSAVEEYDVIFDPEDDPPEDEQELLRLAEKILTKDR